MSVHASARRDLVKKIELEQDILKKLRAFNNATVRNIIKSLNDQNATYNASNDEEALEQLLNRHYIKTGSAFDSRLSDVMPEDIPVTNDEENLISSALLAYFALRAKDQAKIITRTNQKNINQSVSEARETEDADGNQLSRQEQAVTAGALASRRLRGREAGIASTETQNPAETSKATEAEVLSGQQPSIVAGTQSSSSVEKTWLTAGDEIVRNAHVLADSQIKNLSKPYSVGGQLLRWPGDTSLGASVENVINCRCSSIISAQDVFAERRRRGQEPVFDTELSDQLIESLG